ncbi:MAG: SpoIIE family protein phosphatase [candidate division KSB1 bacterium]|nr:SpoIIE family protein phosphatase [candidate division KSB1 bacterium]MDZ7336787.1 SpoIIE family protein phosphatase [candidate division KSB1 bacterium]
MQTIPQLEKEIQRLKIAVEELSVLNELAIAASSSLEVRQMLDIIVQKSIKAVKAEQGSISLVTEQEETPFRTFIRQVDRTHDQMPYRVGAHITGWILKNKKPLLIENLATDQRFKASEQEQKEIRSVLCVPIWSQAKIIGILMMMNKKTHEPFNDNDLRLLSIIAAQSGQLIRNSQLQEEALEKKRLEFELSLARRIQTNLLPKTAPITPHLDIASYFNPAEEVGGDYYDYFWLGDEQIGVVIADVSGHGPAAAMMMTLVKGILHSMVQQFASPEKSLSEINSIIARIAPRDVFITMMFLIFDLNKKVLRISNAGHNPIVHYNSQSRSCQLVELKGCALNLIKQCDYDKKEIPLQPNDLFLIYTDGVTEATNENQELFEERRLIQAVEEMASQSADAVIQNVKSKLNSFMGKAKQADDVLVIAMKVSG